MLDSFVLEINSIPFFCVCVCVFFLCETLPNSLCDDGAAGVGVPHRIPGMFLLIVRGRCHRHLVLVVLTFP